MPRGHLLVACPTGRRLWRKAWSMLRAKTYPIWSWKSFLVPTGAVGKNVSLSGLSFLLSHFFFRWRVGNRQNRNEPKWFSKWWISVRLIGVWLSSCHFKLSFLHHTGGVLGFFWEVNFSIIRQTQHGWIFRIWQGEGTDVPKRCILLAWECGRSVQTNIFKTHSEQHWLNCEYIKKRLSKSQSTASSMWSEDCSRKRELSTEGRFTCFHHWKKAQDFYWFLFPSGRRIGTHRWWLNR